MKRNIVITLAALGVVAWIGWSLGATFEANASGMEEE